MNDRCEHRTEFCQLKNNKGTRPSFQQKKSRHSFAKCIFDSSFFSNDRPGNWKINYHWIQTNSFPQCCIRLRRIKSFSLPLFTLKISDAAGESHP